MNSVRPTPSGRPPLRWIGVAYLALLGASHVSGLAGCNADAEIPPGALLQTAAASRDAGERRYLHVPVQYAEDRPGPPQTHVNLSYLEFTPPQSRPDQSLPTIIALHGSPGNARNLELVADGLSQHHHVIVPDLPGFGKSDRWIPDYSIRAHARYVLQLMDALRIKRAFVFAHSMGSGVTIELTRLAPERIAGIAVYGGIGVQEGEGSGDYYIEHAKYVLGYGGLVILPELLPHFGWLGTRSFRHAFIRNFLDSDQRPLRAAIQKIRVPVLLIQGAHDPLVPAWTAEEYHRLIPHSELFVLDDSHFMVFNAAGSTRLINITLDFLNRYQRILAEASEHSQTDGADDLSQRFASARRTRDDETRGPGIAVRETTEHLDVVQLPVALDLGPRLTAWAKLGAIITGTFVSEDLTCISAGLLIRANRLDLFTGLLGCFIGIFLGDLGLYLMGRLVGLGLLRSKRISSLLPPDALQNLADRFDREGWKLIFVSRFVPGTRFPVYTGAGIIGGRAGRLILIALLAGLIWTPALILLTIFFGPAILGPLEYFAGEGWLAIILAIVLIFFALRLIFSTGIALLTADGRRELKNKLGRAIRVEFWPPYVFYAPLVPACIWFTIRYRGFGTLTASNPGIRDGGLIGESKAEILDCLPAPWVLPYLLIDASGTPAERAARVFERIGTDAGDGQHRWEYPIILKPDVAQRGLGLRLARNAEQVRAYFETIQQPVIAQVYHAGPFEAGVFYYRMPGAATGNIFSITDKVFPEVIGDGRSTLKELIEAHPRYRLQTRTFFERHAARLKEVPAAGAAVRLAIAGNHAQGTLFREGKHLYTETLRERVDEIARQFPGFYFGRFDVRYSTVEGFMAGREFAIVELNGATSESTNLYDPDASIGFVYGTLFRQWDLLFRIGYANRKLGHPGLSIPGILRELWRYRRKRTEIPGD